MLTSSQINLPKGESCVEGIRHCKIGLGREDNLFDSSCGRKKTLIAIELDPYSRQLSVDKGIYNDEIFSTGTA